MYFNYFLLLFTITNILFMTNGDKEEVDSLMSGLDNINSEEYVKNGKFYKPKTGALFYTGMNTGYSEGLNLFFKKRYALTNPTLRINYCLGEKNLTEMNSACDKGILLCYESQIRAWYMRDAYSNSTVALRKRFDDPDLACENATHFGFYVSANNTHFTVKATLDAHIYQFPIPPPHNKDNNVRCFVLNMGSNNSLETTITNMHGKKLIYTGNAPQNLVEENPFFEEESMNLWMLLIDLIPYYPPNIGYYPLAFYFRGGGPNCTLDAEFSTDTVHVCKQDMEFIGSCEPTYLDSADMECTATLSASKTVEQGTDRQTSRSSTDTQSHTNTNGGEDSTQNEFNVGAEVTGHAKVGFGVAEAGISVTLKGGYRRQWESKHVWSVEDRTETSATRGSSDTHVLREVKTEGKDIAMKIHRTDGGHVNFYQLVLKCGGDIIRYHKVYAVGDAEHGQKGGPPQSTVVYQAHDGSHPVLNVNINMDVNVTKIERKSTTGRKHHDPNA